MSSPTPLPNGATRSTTRVETETRQYMAPVTVGPDAEKPANEALSAATPTTSLPVVTGAPVVGETLCVDVSAWPRGTAFGFQWHVDGEAIDGANEPCLRLTSAHTYRSISVTVYVNVPRQPGLAVRSAPTRLVIPGA